MIDSGMAISVRSSQDSNASAEISLIPSGITVFLQANNSLSVDVSMMALQPFLES